MCGDGVGFCVGIDEEECVAEETKGEAAGEHPMIAMGRNSMPVAKLIGFELAEAGDGRAVVTLEAGPQHTNPMGTLHGGILCDIADSAMGRKGLAT